MSGFGIVHGVPCTATIARYTIDRLGRLRCEACDPELASGEHGAFRVAESAGEIWANCDLCGKSPWEARVQVPATASVEYVACRIF